MAEEKFEKLTIQKVLQNLRNDSMDDSHLTPEMKQIFTEINKYLTHLKKSMNDKKVQDNSTATKAPLQRKINEGVSSLKAKMFNRDSPGFDKFLKLIQTKYPKGAFVKKLKQSIAVNKSERIIENINKLDEEYIMILGFCTQTLKTLAKAKITNGNPIEKIAKSLASSGNKEDYSYAVKILGECIRKS